MYVSASSMCLVSQEASRGYLEGVYNLEGLLQAVVSNHVCTGNQAGVFCKSSQYFFLNCWAISPAPQSGLYSEFNSRLAWAM